MYKVKRLRFAVPFIIIIALGIGTIFFSRELGAGIKNGINFSAGVLVPSLFPFMVLASAASKALKIKGKFISTISGKLFGISAESMFAVIMGIFGGYPVGASSVSALYKSGAIPEAEAVKTSYIAFGAGPAFLISFAGIQLFQSAEIGIVLFISQISAVIVIGIINKFLIKNNYNSKAEIKGNKFKGSIFVSSVSDAVHGVIGMCAMVCIFSAILSVADNYFGIYADIILEVTSACNKLSIDKNIILTAFAVGFGGVCVHFQVFQILSEIRINKLIFFFCRIIQGILTTAFTFLQIKIFNITIPVFSSVNDEIVPALSGSVIGSVLLILTGISFLYSIRRSICAE